MFDLVSLTIAAMVFGGLVLRAIVLTAAESKQRQEQRQPQLRALAQVEGQEFVVRSTQNANELEAIRVFGKVDADGPRCTAPVSGTPCIAWSLVILEKSAAGSVNHYEPLQVISRIAKARITDEQGSIGLESPPNVPLFFIQESNEDGTGKIEQTPWFPSSHPEAEVRANSKALAALLPLRAYLLPWVDLRLELRAQKKQMNSSLSLVVREYAWTDSNLHVGVRGTTDGRKEIWGTANASVVLEKVSIPAQALAWRSSNFATSNVQAPTSTRFQTVTGRVQWVQESCTSPVSQKALVAADWVFVAQDRLRVHDCWKCNILAIQSADALTYVDLTYVQIELNAAAQEVAEADVASLRQWFRKFTFFVEDLVLDLRTASIREDAIAVGDEITVVGKLIEREEPESISSTSINQVESYRASAGTKVRWLVGTREAPLLVRKGSPEPEPSA